MLRSSNGKPVEGNIGCTSKGKKKKTNRQRFCKYRVVDPQSKACFGHFVEVVLLGGVILWGRLNFGALRVLYREAVPFSGSIRRFAFGKSLLFREVLGPEGPLGGLHLGNLYYLGRLSLSRTRESIRRFAFGKSLLNSVNHTLISALPSPLGN